MKIFVGKFFFSLLSVLIMQTFAYASSDAGIEIKMDNLNLSIKYSVAADYKGTDTYIRDPQYVLFDILQFFKNNEKKLSGINKSIEVYLYEGDYVEIHDITDGGYTVLSKIAVSGNFAGKIVDFLCVYLLKGQCVHKVSPIIPLYNCGRSEQLDRIRFGSFPSEELNDKYSLKKCLNENATPAQISITRRNINKYFTTK